MMAYALLGIMVAVVMVYIVSVRLRFRDLPIMAFLFSVSFFLSRFDVMARVDLLGRPLLGLHLYLAASGIFLLILRGLAGRRYLPATTRVIQLFWLVAILALLSGFINGGANGVGAALQVLVIVLAPALVAAMLIELVPLGREESRQIRKVFILFGGVITPSILVMTALLPGVFADTLGWRPIRDEVQAGFVRGWSPLGSTITTGAVVILAYAMSLHEAVSRNRRIYVFVCMLSGLSLMFTLARSVLVVFVIFHAYYWIVFARHRRRHGVLVWPAGLAVLAFVAATTLGGYDFGRFLKTDDFSIEMRGTSARVALAESSRAPLLGRGPGLLYEDIRTVWLVDPDNEEKAKVVSIGGEMSAQEPHNLYLWLAAEHGWPSVILFLLIFFTLWRGARPPGRAPDATTASLRTIYGAAWLGFALFFLSHSGPLVNPQFSLFFWFWAFSGVHWCASLCAERAGELNEE